MVRQRLQKLVSENRLEAFYPPQRLDQVAQFVASKDVEGLGQRWRLPREVSHSLFPLEFLMKQLASKYVNISYASKYQYPFCLEGDSHTSVEHILKLD